VAGHYNSRCPRFRFLSSKICPRPRSLPRVFVLDMSLYFLFGPCEIVCNASIGNISEFAMVSSYYLLTYYVNGCIFLMMLYTVLASKDCPRFRLWPGELVLV